jgi:hypothetical protein
MSCSPAAAVLAAISVVGAVAIPFRHPQFIGRAIALELAFIALTVLVYKNVRRALYPCIPLAALVMLGNCWRLLTSR